MHVEAANPVIRKSIQDIMTHENYTDTQCCYDTDNVSYKIFGLEDLKQIRFCYRGNSSKEIMAAGGKDMLEEVYADYQLDEAEWDPDFDITLKIDCSGLPKTHKISKKNMDEETQDKLREENDKIRIERKALVNPIAELVSKFKMYFISAPIRRFLKSSLEGKQIDQVEIAYRVDEKYWVVMPAKNEVQVFFGVNFSNTTDQSLGRVMLLEWQDSTRKVKAAPSITFYDK